MALRYSLTGIDLLFTYIIYNKIFVYKILILYIHFYVKYLIIVLVILIIAHIYLIFYIKNSDRYSRDDIIAKLPNDVQCWYAPKSAFVDELMLKAAKMLHTNSKILLLTVIF